MIEDRTTHQLDGFLRKRFLRHAIAIRSTCRNWDLLVTLDKSGHGSEFQYRDHFINRNEFEWQSQNRTAQDGSDGRDIRNHVERGFAVHLFIRGQKRMKRGGGAPFTYCGDVQFADWHGNRPVTVRWKLRADVPDGIWTSLGNTEPQQTT